jgi:Ala-tRNA(Pro) deacylase
MSTIYDVLEALHIPFIKIDHPAVFTVEEASKVKMKIDAGECKNLFLRNRKGDAHYLFVVESTRPVDLKKLAAHLGEKSLSFASPERLMQHLAVTPGSVSPFALINDTDHVVRVLIDSGLFQHEKIGFHPNINTATLIVSRDDFKKFLDSLGNSLAFLNDEFS